MNKLIYTDWKSSLYLKPKRKIKRGRLKSSAEVRNERIKYHTANNNQKVALYKELTADSSIKCCSKCAIKYAGPICPKC